MPKEAYCRHAKGCTLLSRGDASSPGARIGEAGAEVGRRFGGISALFNKCSLYSFLLRQGPMSCRLPQPINQQDQWARKAEPVRAPISTTGLGLEPSRPVATPVLSRTNEGRDNKYDATDCYSDIAIQTLCNWFRLVENARASVLRIAGARSSAICLKGYSAGKNC